MTAEVDTSQFRHHVTRAELNSLLRHGHIIPVSKGWTKEYVDTHFPGWSWNALINVIKAAGILIHRGGAPPKCDDRVEILHFSSDADFLVEWTH